ncbi:MAG: hypothetical protein WCK48_01260 [bacterium]
MFSEVKKESSVITRARVYIANIVMSVAILDALIHTIKEERFFGSSLFVIAGSLLYMAWLVKTFDAIYEAFVNMNPLARRRELCAICALGLIIIMIFIFKHQPIVGEVFFFCL